jgi:cell division protein FtsN
MRMGIGKLVCLVLGVLLLSLGGGMIGGRLAVKRHLSTVADRSPATEEPAKAPLWKEPPPAGDEAALAPTEPVVSARPASAPVVTPHEKEESGDAVDSQTKYVIQTISASKRSDARAARQKIMAAGFPAGIFEAELSGAGKVYRVYVGPYDDEADARAALKEIRGLPGFGKSFLKMLD